LYKNKFIIRNLSDLMNTKTLTQFKDLPESIQDILLSDESTDANDRIIKEFNLSVEQIKIFFDVLRKIIFKQISLDQLLEALEPLGLGEEQTKKITVEILRNRILPLSDYLKVNTLLYIKKWGGEIPVDELSELVKIESQGKINVDSVIDQIIKEAGLELKDDIIRNRFKNIILSFIRNVRSSIETVIVLKRSSKIGGIGLEQEMIDKIMEILRKEDQRVQTVSLPTKKIIDTEKAQALMKSPVKGLLKIETKMLKVFPKKKPSFLKLKKKNKKPLTEKTKEVDIEREEIIQNKKPLTEKTKEVDIEKEEIIKDVEEAIKEFQPKRVVSPIKEIVLEKKILETKPVSSSDSPVLNRNLAKSNKVMVESVSGHPRIYGPSDELRSISLIDWRRWGTSQEAIFKIKEKINLLGEDSLVKKAEGIKAWKESEVNKLYLELGEESINKGKSVEETIRERQKEGRKTLSEEEFNAVVELNQNLRF